MQHMLLVVQHMCVSVRLKLSQPSLAGVGAGAELGKMNLADLDRIVNNEMKVGKACDIYRVTAEHLKHAVSFY